MERISGMQSGMNMNNAGRTQHKGNMSNCNNKSSKTLGPSNQLSTSQNSGDNNDSAQPGNSSNSINITI